MHKFEQRNLMHINKKVNDSKHLLNSTKFFYSNYDSKSSQLQFAEPILKEKDNRVRNLLKKGSCWARNLEIKDKKNKLAKFNTNRDDALIKLESCVANLKRDHWRNRLVINDRIDVLFNTNPNSKTCPYIHATIIEERLIPNPKAKIGDDDENFKEFRIGFRMYCDNGEDEDKNFKRYNGWAEE